MHVPVIGSQAAGCQIFVIKKSNWGNAREHEGTTKERPIIQNDLPIPDSLPSSHHHPNQRAFGSTLLIAAPAFIK